MAVLATKVDKNGKMASAKTVTLFNPEFLEWTLLSSNLGTSIFANWGVIEKSKTELQTE